MIANFRKKINKDSASKVLFQIAGVFLFVIIVVLLLADFRIYKKKRELKLQLDSYQSKIEELENNNKSLNSQIENIGNEDYLEKIAYEQGMVRVGERGVIFIVPETEENNASGNENIWSGFTGWLSAGWSWIKSKF